GASIVVLGTEFTVTVTEHTSRVSLLSGHVRFVHDGNGAVDMKPGQQLTFEAKTGKAMLATVSPADSSQEPSQATAPRVTSPEASNAPPPVAPLRVAPIRDDSPLAADLPAQPKHHRTASSPRAAESASAGSSDLQAALELRAQGRYDE